MLIAALPHAHADIKSIDTSAARKAPGVLLVFTGEDVKKAGYGDLPCLVPINNRDGSARADTPRPMLAQGRVRHVGDPVALVVAETLEQAKDAAELIEIDYEARPHTTDTYASAQPGAPLVHDHIKDNLVFDWEMGDRARTEAAFKAAARTVSLRIVNNRLVVNSMEPRGAICEYDAKDDRSTLWVSSQGVTSSATAIAKMVLKIGPDKLRVITGDVGGGFGMKIFVLPEYPLVSARRARSAAGEVDPRPQEAFLATRTAATTSPTPRSRSTRTASSLACASRPSRHSAPISAITGRSSRPWPAPACWPAYT